VIDPGAEGFRLDDPQIDLHAVLQSRRRGARAPVEDLGDTRVAEKAIENHGGAATGGQEVQIGHRVPAPAVAPDYLGALDVLAGPEIAQDRLDELLQGGPADPGYGLSPLRQLPPKPLFPRGSKPADLADGPLVERPLEVGQGADT
jgi:hypothetical protein